MKRHVPTSSLHRSSNSQCLSIRPWPEFDRRCTFSRRLWAEQVVYRCQFHSYPTPSLRTFAVVSHHSSAKMWQGTSRSHQFFPPRFECPLQCLQGKPWDKSAACCCEQPSWPPSKPKAEKSTEHPCPEWERLLAPLQLWLGETQCANQQPLQSLQIFEMIFRDIFPHLPPIRRCPDGSADPAPPRHPSPRSPPGPRSPRPRRGPRGCDLDHAWGHRSGDGYWNRLDFLDPLDLWDDFHLFHGAVHDHRVLPLLRHSLAAHGQQHE